MIFYDFWLRHMPGGKPLFLTENNKALHHPDVIYGWSTKVSQLSLGRDV